MAHILIMPRQGNTVESCIITEWKVKEGDTVTSETTICEVETDKASFEVPAGAGGTVLKLLYEAGDDVPVLKPIAVIGEANENWQALLEGNIPKTSHGDTKTQSSPVSGPQSQVPDSKPPIPGSQSQISSTQPLVSDPQSPLSISPRARNLAGKEAIKMAPGTVAGSGPGGRIIERDIVAALQNQPLLTAAAKAAGPGTVHGEGSGIGGRVTLGDLSHDAAVSGPFSPTLVPPSPLVSPFPAEGAITETPIKGIRKVIAERMHKSLADSAQLTLNASAPASKLQGFRSGAKIPGGIAEELGLSKVSINDLILFAVSRTLPRFPYMNAHKSGNAIKAFERVHLAVAVDTPRGLMVPVIRNANLLALSQISLEAKRLAAACQNGTAAPDELSGSTFTVTNLGSLGIESFTPILNTPEVAILGVCGIEMKPVAAQSAEQPESASLCNVRFEPHIGFSLTIDHEAIDGAPAARFLKALCEAIAHIDILLAAR